MIIGPNIPASVTEKGSENVLYYRSGHQTRFRKNLHRDREPVDNRTASSKTNGGAEKVEATFHREAPFRSGFFVCS